jgi:hypothetical protein
MRQLTITSDDLLRFDIKLDGLAALLRQDQRTWYLTDPAGANFRYIGNGRMGWISALIRALRRLEAETQTS